VAKAVSVLEEQIKREGTDVARRFKKLKAEFKTFVTVFEDYLSESCAKEIEFTVPCSPELVKSKSDEVASSRPAADANLLSQSI
jgi:hypothetical protein